MGQFKNRRLDSFGPLFFKLTKHALEQVDRSSIGGAPLFKFDAGSHGAAINLAMQIRQYWNAALGAAQRGELLAMDPLTPLVPLLPKIAVRHQRGTSVVEIIHREQMASHKLLATALGELDKALAGTGAPLEPQLPRGEAVDSIARAVAAPTGAQEAILEQTYGVGGGNAKAK